VIGTSTDEQAGINGRDCSLPASGAPASITDFDIDTVRLSTAHSATGFATLFYISLVPHAGSGSCGFFVRIGQIRFLAGCRKRRLNQG